MQSTCKATVYISDDCKSIVKISVSTHNHDPMSEKQILKEKVANSVKRKALDDFSNSPAKIVRSEIVSADAVRSFSEKDVVNVRRCVYRSRRKVIPRLPKTLEETMEYIINLEFDDIMIVSGEKFLLFHDRVANILCFSTPTNLKELCSSPSIFVDGTFSYCAKFFTQLFTIHVTKNGHYIPLVFFLLPDKKATTYTAALTQLVKKCTEMGLRFVLQHIVADFEEGIHTAARNVFRDIAVVGCRFHLTQSWWRKIQKLGLSCDYKEKGEVGDWLRWTFGLPLLPHNEVEESFVEDLMSIMPRDNRVEQYADYLVENYIEEDAKFPPHLWARNELSSARTTNMCESFHRKFNALFCSAHPNIFVFLDALKKMEIDSITIINGSHAPKLSSNYTFRQQKKKVDQLILNYNQGNIPRLHFLQCASYHYCKTKYCSENLENIPMGTL